MGWNERRQLVKPRSSLPASWFTVRECLHRAFELEYVTINEEVKNSYHHVYRELAFFVEDEQCAKFNAALDIAVSCRVERMKSMGIAQDAASCRSFIASEAVKAQKGEEIWDQLAEEVTCPRKDLLVLANTLIYCSAMYRTMWDEWAAFTNLVAARQKEL